MPEPGRETSSCVPFRGQPPVDRALAALTSAQHALIELDQLLALGLSASGVRKRVAAGRLHRIHRGVYSLVPRELLTREGWWLAAVFACGPGALLSHRSAAALLGLRTNDRAVIDVTVPTRATRKRSGIDIHRSTTLVAADGTRVRNIPCTTVARTQIDLAEVLNRRGVERAMDQAAILRLFDRAALEDQVARNRTRRGAKRLRVVLDEHYAGETVTRSELEERFLSLIRAAGIPRPEVNVWVVLDDGEPPIQADFQWRAERLIVEVDGHRTHGTRQAFERDRERDQRLTAARWRPVRLTWRQVTREPDRVAAMVAALLRC